MFTSSLVESVEVFHPESGYKYVGQNKRLRISIFASTILKVMLEYSPDGVRPGLTLMYRVPSEQWKSDLHEVMMPYLRLHIVNESGKPCPELLVHMWEPGKDRHVEFQSVEIVPSPSPAPVSRSKSPWNPLRKKSVPDPQPSLCGQQQATKIATQDHRLPNFIPNQCLLVGSEKGQVNILPKGLPGEVLMMTEIGPSWCMLYPPQLSKNEQDKVDANKWMEK